jgi:hypothetical protein
VRQIVAAFSAVAVFALGGVVLAQALETTRSPLGTLSLPIAMRLESWRLEQAARERPADERLVIWFGDSTSYHANPRHMPHRLLRKAAERRRPGIELVVYPVVAFGLDVFGYYALADEVVASDPDLVVLGFNLGSVDWQRSAIETRARLAGWIGPERLLQTLWLPMHEVGLSADRLLLYATLVRAGLSDAWLWTRQQQSRVGQAWTDLAHRADALRGDDVTRRLSKDSQRAFLDRRSDDGWHAYNEVGARAALGHALAGLTPDEPMVQVLAATVAHLHGAGLPVIVYVVPLNVENLDRIGIDRSGLERSIARVREQVEGAGGRLVDLHDLLPDATFSDPTHFRDPVEPGGLDELARALTDPVLQELPERHPGAG